MDVHPPPNKIMNNGASQIIEDPSSPFFHGYYGMPGLLGVGVIVRDSSLACFCSLDPLIAPLHRPIVECPAELEVTDI